MSTVYVRFALKSAEERQRCVPLERLLARADAVAEVGDWRADAWARLGGGAMPAPGPAVYAACCDQAQAAARAPTGAIFLATPVHYVAEMTTVRMGALPTALTPDEAQAMAADFNRIWNDGSVRLLASPAGQLLCLFTHALVTSTRDPAEAGGEPIDRYLASGVDARELRLLMSEIEMWLFDAPLNRARRAHGAPEISGLWLWGGGAPLPAAWSGRPMAEICSWSSGGDVCFDALAAAVGVPAAQTAGRSGVLVIDGVPQSAAWREFEAGWLPQLLAGLQAGPSPELNLSAGARRFSISARWRRRFWRRPRPWWELFA